MTSPTLGIQNQRLDNDTIAVSRPDFSKLIALDVSDDADASVFPIGEPVRFSGGDTAKLAKLGTGPLADAVRGAQAQLGTTAVDATVMRVAGGDRATAVVVRAPMAEQRRAHRDLPAARMRARVVLVALAAPGARRVARARQARPATPDLARRARPAASAVATPTATSPSTTPAPLQVVSHSHEDYYD